MITIPGLDSVTDILDTDQVMVTNAAGQSYKIAGSELNKRNKIIIANGTTVTGAPLKTGNCVRIYFTVALSANDANTVLQLNYNNVTYNVKVPKDGALQNYVAFEVSSGVFKYLQAYTTLELLFDGTQFVIVGNPVVISNSDYVICADGSITYSKLGTRRYIPRFSFPALSQYSQENIPQLVRLLLGIPNNVNLVCKITALEKDTLNFITYVYEYWNDPNNAYYYKIINSSQGIGLNILNGYGFINYIGFDDTKEHITIVEILDNVER